MKRLAMTFCAAALLFASCGKKQDVSCLAGGGGNLMVRVVPNFNGNALISTATSAVEVYVAFGVVDFPGKNPNNYNKSVSGKNNNPYVKVHNLKCGMYYFFATYTDETSGETYAGGAPMTTEQQNGEVELMLVLTKE